MTEVCKDGRVFKSKVLNFSKDSYSIPISYNKKRIVVQISKTTSYFLLELKFRTSKHEVGILFV